MTDGGMSASALRGSKVMSKRPLPGQNEEYTRRDRTGLPPDGVSALWRWRWMTPEGQMDLCLGGRMARV